jgi:hypothetical protein
MRSDVSRRRSGDGRVYRLRDAEIHGTNLVRFIQLDERVAKLATKTHKDRVSEFNSKLEALSEHHDIPKVCRTLAFVVRRF